MPCYPCGESSFARCSTISIIPLPETEYLSRSASGDAVIFVSLETAAAICPATITRMPVCDPQPCHKLAIGEQACAKRDEFILAASQIQCANQARRY